MASDIDARADALEQIARIARRHGLTAGDVAQALAGSADASQARSDMRRRGVLVRVLAFLGGTFVFAGLGLFIALQWDEMNSAARVIITLGSGLCSFVLAVLAARDTRFARAATPLFLIAAALQPAGMFVTFAEYGSGGDWRMASLITAGTMMLQFGAVTRALGRSVTLFMAIVFAVLFWWTAFDLLHIDGDVTALVLGAGMVLAAVGLERSRHADITPFWYLVGAAALHAGLFSLVESTPAEILFLAAAAGFVYLATLVHSRTLLFVATLAILAYTGWFTAEHFANSLGWPVALMVFGLLMIGLSAAALRIDRTYVRRERGAEDG